ncbi:spore germination protein GerPC [Cohnella sp. 56]|uniref:spore germination protein GerPC n=1 Tax=Cohnella sp. 56 TaxID=3113722 RepID=UPI0030E8285A
MWHYPYGQAGDDCTSRLTALAAQVQAAEAQIAALRQQITALTQQQEQTQAQVAQMQTRVEDLQRKPPVHVEYHFDQLKVSRLDGTLNIGLSPNAQSGVDSFDVPVPGTWQTPAVGSEGAEPFIPGLMQQGNDFMNTNAPADLSAIASQNGMSLQPAELRAVLGDVTAQLGARIQHYARTVPLPANGGEDELNAWRQGIMNKVKKDIRTAFENYVNRRAAESGGQKGR